MPNLKEIKRRISSVKKTRQITSAMKLVSAAKLKRATDSALAAQPYQDQLAGVLSRVAASAAESVSDPLLEQREEIKRVLVVVLTSDRGLCGGFNASLLRFTQKWLAERSAIDVTLRIYGRKGRDFMTKRQIAVDDAQVELGKVPKMDLVRPLGEHMVHGFVEGTYDEVYLVYNIFKNAITQIPTARRVLPAVVEGADDDGPSDYAYEPDPQTLLGHLLPLYLRTIVLQAFLETEAGEHAARMTAMDNATKNASELIDNLTLEYNRARQAAITREIVEIVAGAEAL